MSPTLDHHGKIAGTVSALMGTLQFMTCALSMELVLERLTLGKENLLEVLQCWLLNQ